MKIFSLVSVLVLSTLSQSICAKGKNEDASGISGQVRLGYINTDDNVNNLTTLSIGGKLGYTSPSYKGLTAGAVFYTTNPIAGKDDNGFFLDSNNEGYSILGEAWLNADIGKTSIKLGRQGLDIPFADTDDIGMIQNNIEGLVIRNHNLPNTELFAAYLSRWAGVDSPQPEKFVKLDHDKGIAVLGVNYEAEKWAAQLWHYDSDHGTDMSYADATIKPNDALEFGVQYANQNDTTVDNSGFDGNVWGATAAYTIKDTTIALDYNKVSGGQVTNGFGGGPFYTSGIDHTIAEADDQKATAIGIEYTGLKDWTFGIRNIAFTQGENELDLTASYQIRENLSTGFEYADMHNDGTITKAFLNFDF